MSNIRIPITIEVVKGGFVLTYPSPSKESSVFNYSMECEVFTSQRKLTQKLKDVLDTLSTTPDDSKGD